MGFPSCNEMAYNFMVVTLKASTGVAQPGVSCMLVGEALVDGWMTQELSIVVQGINATVEIIPTIKCQVDLGKVLGIRSFNLEKVLEMDPAFLQVAPPCCSLQPVPATYSQPPGPCSPCR